MRTRRSRRKRIVAAEDAIDGMVTAPASDAVDEILPRLMNDDQLGRFWQNRGRDGIARERQLLIDYLSNAAGGPMYYTGRDMTLSHVGMGISDGDWSLFTGHIAAALDHLSVGEPERGDVLGFIEGLKGEIVEC